jgi:hypothetical protein
MQNEHRRFQKMTSKNPFEVRLDVMKLARDMLEKDFEARRQKYLNKLEVLKAEKPAPDFAISFIEDNAPLAYTSNDILAKATELYSFIDSRKIK